MSPEAPQYVYANTHQPFRFRIVHLFYIMAVLGASAATFGPGGLVCGLMITGFWAIVFFNNSRPRGLAIACGVLLGSSCLFCLMMPAMSSAREAARRMSCANNLKQIGIALHNYHDTHGVLPPAYLADENGKPLHSWRVLILPYIESSATYGRYRFDEPWNGPNNRKLAKEIPYCYVCPSHKQKGSPHCSYQVVVGPKAAFQGEQSRSFDEFVGGTQNSVMVIEDSSQAIHWMEPRDLTYEQAIASLQSDNAAGRHKYQDFFWEYYVGRNVGFADGRVHFIARPLDRGTVRSLLDVDKQVNDRFDDGYRSRSRSRRLRVGNCVRLGILGFLAVLPFPWVWLRAKPKPKPSNNELNTAIEV